MNSFPTPVGGRDLRAALCLFFILVLGRAAAAEMLFDSVDPSSPTQEGGGGPGLHWNNITSDIAQDDFGYPYNLVDTEGTATQAYLEMCVRFDGVDENGTLDSTVYPVSATRDSCYANTEAFNGLENVFPESRVATRFEEDIQAFEQTDALNPPPVGPFVFTGSSSIRGWPDLPGTFPEHPVLNRGFGGSQMSDLLYYFDRVVAAYTPSLVVVYEGDNDLNDGKSVKEVLNDYREFLDRVKKALPETGVALLAVKPSPSRLACLQQQRDLNTQLASLAAQDPQVVFIDVFTPLVDAAGQPREELFQTDLLHLNAEGYAIWTSLIRAVLDDWKRAAGHAVLLDSGTASTTTDLEGGAGRRSGSPLGQRDDRDWR
jgi:lysophospholipase L1-like esterase